MGRNSTVKVSVVADDKDFTKTIDHADRKVVGFRDKFKSFASGALTVAAGASVLKFGSDSVAAFKESEAAQSRLQDAFAKFPAMANVSIGSLRDLNSQLAKKVKYDDDALASGQAVLAQFGLSGEQVKALTPLLADYAAKTGKDIPGAAEDLGKAMLGQGRALKTIGLDFKDAGSATANYDQLMAGLRQQVGGFAEKEGKTTSGRAEILRNQFGELQEKVGAALVPALSKLAEVLLGVTNFFGGLDSRVQIGIGVLAGLLGVVLLVSKAVQAWTAVQGALNVVLSMNPIGLVVIGLAALAVYLVWAYKHSETFRKVVDGAFRGVATAVVFMKDVAVEAFKFMVDKWLAAAEWVVKAGAAAFGWVPGIGGKLKDAARQIETFRDDVNNMLGGIKDKTVSVTMAQRTEGSSMPGRPQARARGGPVVAGSTYLVGEEGPELLTPGASGAVTPLGKSSPTLVEAPGGGSGAPTLVTLRTDTRIDGSDLSVPELRRAVGEALRHLGPEIVAALKKFESQNGKRWRTT